MKLTRRQLLAGVSSVASLTMLTTPARAAAAVVTHGLDWTGSTGGLTSTTYDTTGANTLVVFVSTSGVSSVVFANPGVTDSLGNIWLGPFYPAVNAAGSYASYVCPNARSGSGYTYTVHAGVSQSGGTGACFVALSGVDTSHPLVTGGRAENGFTAVTTLSLTDGTVASSPALTTFDDGDLILTFVSTYTGTATQAVSGFTALDRIAFNGSILAMATAYEVQSSAGTINPTWTWGTSQDYAATISLAFSPAAPKVVTWSVASGGDAAFSNSDTTVLDTVAGPDNTYFSLGNTSPATAADSTHIYVADAETAASVVGHPVQLGAGNICIALSQTTSGGHTLVTVGCPVGSSGTYSANFGTTPGSGAAYTIYPMRRVFSVGAPSAGHTTWSMSPTIAAGSNRGMVDISPISSQAYDTRVTSALGPSGWAYDAANGVGTPVDGSSQICVKSGGTPEVATFFLWTDNVWFDNLYIQNVNDISTNDGIFNTNQISLVNTGFTRCLLRSAASNPGDNHYAMSTGGLGTEKGQGVQFNVCGMIGTTRLDECISAMAYVARHCTIICTDTMILTAAAGSSGNTVNVVSTTGVYSATFNATTYYPGYLGHPAVPPGWGGPTDGFDITATTSTTLTIRNALTSTITAGDQIVLSMGAAMKGVNSDSIDTGLFKLEQCAMFGFVQPVNFLNTHYASDILSNNASDYASGSSGFTIMSYAAQFNAAFGAGDGTIDIRPKAGNGLSIGTADANFTTDLVGNAYAMSNPSVGAIQYQAPAGPGGANFFHPGPF